MRMSSGPGATGENDALGGRDPYSASARRQNLHFHRMLGLFSTQEGLLGRAALGAGNVIGGGDWAVDRIVPDCIRAIEADEPVVLRNPDATRPWQHVLEPISGYLQLAERLYAELLEWGGAWNFGPATQQVRTVKDVADALMKNIGRGRVVTDVDPAALHEARLLQLNCDKAHQLGYPRHVDKTL